MRTIMNNQALSTQTTSDRLEKMKRHTSTSGIFPRNDDGKGWAWGLSGSKPEKIWERFSPAYETQAQAILVAMARYWPQVGLDWAGSEDGEAVIGLSSDGTLQFCYHLEDPRAAKTLADAIAAGRIDAFLKDMIEARPRRSGY